MLFRISAQYFAVSAQKARRRNPTSREREREREKKVPGDNYASRNYAATRARAREREQNNLARASPLSRLINSPFAPRSRSIRPHENLDFLLRRGRFINI